MNFSAFAMPAEYGWADDGDDEDEANKKSNILPIWGNEKSMNINHLILSNIQASLYFKVTLFELKTAHEVIDEIWYNVTHLEPWEKGSRKTTGQTGMCGGVRGVGTGGIISSCFCILFKLFTLRLTRKQLNMMIRRKDSAYIRALGFMYIRYCQPPADIWEWYEPFLDDEEEIDVKAGGGNILCIGEMLRQFMQKLDWYFALFPRIPVPIQKQIEAKLKEVGPFKKNGVEDPYQWRAEERAAKFGEKADANYGESSRGTSRGDDDRRDRKRSRSRERRRSRSRDRGSRRSPDRSRDHRRRSRSRSRDRRQDRKHDGDYMKDLSREKDRQRKDRKRSRSRDRSGERRRRSRDRSRDRRDRR